MKLTFNCTSLYLCKRTKDFKMEFVLKKDKPQISNALSSSSDYR